MTIQISVVPAEEKLFNVLTDLNRIYYADSHPIFSFSYFKWLHLDNPAGKSNFILAFEGEILVGAMALVPIELRKCALIEKCAFVAQLLTHPGRKIKNLFGKMIEQLKEYAKVNRITLIGHPNTMAILGWKRAKMEFQPPLVAKLAKINMGFDSVRYKKIEPACTSEFPKDFWLGDCEPDYWQLNESFGFLNWRYLHAPFIRYKVNLVLRKGVPVGYQVTRPFKRGIRLLVHFYAVNGSLGDVVKVNRPTIAMVPSSGVLSAEFNQCTLDWLPHKEMPFFLSHPTDSGFFGDVSFLNLGISDF